MKINLLIKHLVGKKYNCMNIQVETVNDLVDANDGVTSFREALLQAKTQPGKDIINFDPIVFGTTPKTITLNLGQLKIDSDVDIIGTSAASLTINGNNLSRVFSIEGAIANISNLTIANGKVQGENGGPSGGGAAGFGGGILIDSSQVTLSGVNFSDNQALGGTGGNGFSAGFNQSNGEAGGNGGRDLSGFSEAKINTGGGFGGVGSVVNLIEYYDENYGYDYYYRVDPAGNGFNSDGGFGGGGGGGSGAEALDYVYNVSGDIASVGGNGGTSLYGGGGGGGAGSYSYNGGYYSPGNGGSSVFGGVGNSGRHSYYSPSTTGAGGGGAGVGGALFVNSGTLNLNNTNFTNNSAIGGIGGSESYYDEYTGEIISSNAASGKGKGGAIFVAEGATVKSTSSITFNNNTAGDAGTTTTDNANLYGTLGTIAIPDISIADKTITEGNSGTLNATFTVSLNNPSSDPVTVVYSTANGTALAGSDYNATNGTLTFTAGQTGKTISVAVKGDTVIESNETFFVNLSNPINGNITDNQGLGTIVNNDFLPKVKISDANIFEGNSGTTPAKFVLNLDKSSSQAITVKYATGNTTALASSDYNATTGTVTFNPGQTSKTISVGVKGESVYELSEIFSVNLSGAVNASIADNQGLGTIANDDSPPEIKITDVSLTEGNSGISNANFVVSLNKLTSLATTVKYATSNGTALVGSDFNTTTGIVTFSAGQTTKTISVGVKGDLIDELSETFSVNLSGATNASIADNKGIGTIIDNDLPPKIKISDNSFNEGDSGVSLAKFTLSLDNPSAQRVTVKYATANGSAIAGSDYNATTSTITFNPGETSKTISVGIKGDLIDEVNETFSVNLSAPTNATISDNQGIGTIIDNDPLSGIKISDSTIFEGNSGISNANFTVSLDKASAKTITVKYGTANGTALSGSDYNATNGTLTFAPGQTSKTVSVGVKGDVLVESDELFSVNLSTATNGSITDSQGVGKIRNNDLNNRSLTGNMSTLTGSLDSDTFVLGDDQGLKYDRKGKSDYGIITGFDSQKDTIQLTGTKSDYILGSSPVATQGVGIFLSGKPQELIAIVSGVEQLNFNQSFSFV